MKMNKLITSAALLLAGAALLQTARADEPDLILGFFTNSGSGSSTNYEVDLGSGSLFTTTTATLSLNSTGTTFNAQNGSGNPTLTYGAVSKSALAADYSNLSTGGSGGVDFLVAGENGASNGGTNYYYITYLNSTPSNGTSGQVGGPVGAISSLYNGLDEVNSGISPAGGTNAFNIATSDLNSLSAVGGSTGSFGGSFSQTTYAIVPTTGSVKLNLYKVGIGSGLATNVGYFTLDSVGDLSFTGSAAAVPEPSTYVLLVLGALGVYVGTRRRNLASV